MDHSLRFRISYAFDALDSGITIPVSLRLGEQMIYCRANIDTGAQVCLFQRETGESLGLPIEQGHRRMMDTLAGSFTAYGHQVTLHTLGLDFDSMVYFAAADNLSRNLLGREGWLQKVRLAVIDYDAAIYLSHYDYT